MEDGVQDRETEEFQRRLGLHFSNPDLLVDALTHSSLRDTEPATNERLEFLGDAVLGMVVSEHLYRRFADFDEGALTRIKSVVVSAKALATRARAMGFESVVRVGKGLRRSRLPNSLLADAFEAVIAAVFIDRGIDEARDFILANLGSQIEAVLNEKHERNFKSLLQNLAQRRFKTTPRYTVVSEEGPDHGKVFEVVACVGSREFPSRRGRNKKEAEQKAAAAAFEALQASDDPGNGGETEDD